MVGKVRVVSTPDTNASQGKFRRLRCGLVRLSDEPALEFHTPVILPGSIAVVEVYPYGRRILMTQRSYATQMRDWQRVRHALVAKVPGGATNA